MAINNVSWVPDEQITSSKMNQMTADEVNSVDDIHPQYIGPTLIVGQQRSFQASLGNAAIFEQFGPDSATIRTDRQEFILGTKNFPRSCELLTISFHVRNTISIDIDFDFMTGTTLTAEQSAFYRIFRNVDGGDAVLEHTSGGLASAANTAYDRSVIVNHTMASLNASTGDFLTVYVAGSISASNLAFFVRAKNFRVVRKF